MKFHNSFGRYDEPDVDEVNGDAEVQDGRLLPVHNVQDVSVVRRQVVLDDPLLARLVSEMLKSI